jgi:anti-sigma B factor antagonist
MIAGVSDAEPLRGPGDDLEIRIDHRDGTAVVRLAGELDIAARPRLEGLLEEVLGAGVAGLVIDCRNLDFVDSGGVAILYMLAERGARDGFSFAIVRGSAVGRLLEVTGLDQQLPVVDHPDDATASAG